MFDTGAFKEETQSLSKEAGMKNPVKAMKRMYTAATGVPAKKAENLAVNYIKRTGNLADLPKRTERASKVIIRSRKVRDKAQKTMAQLTAGALGTTLAVNMGAALTAAKKEIQEVK